MNRIENLQDRLYQLYSRYIDKMCMNTNRYIINHAEEIDCIGKIADLLHDDAEELPEALVHHIHHSDNALTDLLDAWKAAKPNRIEDEREGMRDMFMQENARLCDIYSTEEIDEDLEM